MTPSKKVFVVYGLRLNENPADDKEPMMETEIIGMFPTFADASMCRDVYADLDTTMEAIDITTCESYQEVPDYDIMLHIEVSPNKDVIEINSMCVGEDSEPWIRETSTHCEALAVPEDIDYIVDYMKRWCEENHNTSPTVVDNVSPMAKELIES